MERAVLCLILVWQCWLLYIIDRSWWFIGVVLGAICIGQAVRRIPDARWRTRVWWIVGAAMMVLILALPVRPSSSIPFWVISGEILIPIIRLLLVWLALLVLRPRQPISERVVEFALVLAIFGLCMFRPAFDAQRDFYWVLSAAIGIALLVIGRPTPSRSLAGTRLRQSLLPPGTRWVLIAANFVVIGTWGVTGVLREVADRIQMQVDQVAESNDLMLATGHHYLQIATLDNVTAEKQANPTEVAMWVYCDVQPGYLRGRAYEFLEGDRWLNSNQTRRDVVPLAVDSNPSQLGPLESSNPCFRMLPIRCDQWRSVEVRNVPRRGKAYFSPLHAAYLQGAGRYAAVDAHQILRAGPSTRDPYRFFVPNCPVREPLLASEREQLLALPSNLSTEAAEVLRRIKPSGNSTRAKIQAVESYFHDRYEYSLDPIVFGARRDRLSQFIVEGEHGHCEFFASAAAIALRLMGVPTRYVIGYAVHELEDEEGEFWVARNRDSHAWTEAYSEEDQEWLIVEATPGIEVSRDIWAQSAREENDEEVILGVNQQGGFGGSGWGWFIPRLTAASIAQLGVAFSGILSVAFLVFLYFRSRVQSLATSGYSETKLAKNLRLLDRKLRRRGIVRSRGETLLAFSDRLRQDESGEAWIRDAAQEFEKYMWYRYADRRS